MSVNPLHLSTLNTEQRTIVEESIYQAEIVTELSWVVQIIFFLVGLGRPALSIAAYLFWEEKDQAYPDRGYLSKKLGSTYQDMFMALTIPSFVFSLWAKPRRSDFGYKCFLLFQWLLFVVPYELFKALIDIKDNDGSLGFRETYQIIVRIVIIWGFLFSLVTWNVRRLIAALSDKELSTFLTDKLLFEGFNSLTIAAYFTFEPLICVLPKANKKKQDDECLTLVSAQTGLSYFVILFIFIRLGFGAIPRAELKKQSVSLASVLRGIFSFSDLILGSASVMVMVSVCVLLAYVTGTTDNDKKDEDVLDEDHPINKIGLLGLVMYIFQSIYKGAKITGFKLPTCLRWFRKSQAEQEEPDEGGEEEGDTVNDLNGVMFGVNLDEDEGGVEDEEEILYSVSPFVILVLRIPAYILPYICWKTVTDDEIEANKYIQISSADRTRKHVFMEAASFCYAFIVGLLLLDWGYVLREEISDIVRNVISIFMAIILLIVGLNYQLSLSLLSVEHCSRFLLATANKFLEVVPILVYLTARSARCFFEKPDEWANLVCKSNALSQSYLAIYILSVTGLFSISEYYPPDLRERFTITIAKIAKLDLGVLDAIQVLGLLTIFMCGLWQFANSRTENDLSSLDFTGRIGLVFCAVVNIIEAVKVFLGIQELHARKLHGSETDLSVERTSTQRRRAPVTEMSWVFTFLGMTICLIYNVLEIIILHSAIEKGPDYDATIDIFYSGLLAPFVFWYAGIATFTYCRRTGTLATRSLYGCYIFTAVLPEILAMAKGFFIESYIYALCVSARIVFWFCLFRKVLLPLRKEAAKKSDEELAAFNVNVIMKKSASVFVPVLFFVFESFACIIENENDAKCLTTSIATMFVNCMLVCGLLIRVCTYASTTQVRNACCLSYSSIATFKLSRKHKMEVFLGLVSLGAGLFQASLIGSSEDLKDVKDEEEVGVYHNEIYYVGAVGFYCAVTLFIIEGLSLANASKAFSGENARFLFTKERSMKRFDHKKITEDTIRGGGAL
ncbi:hypothetical protein TrVE_jg14019 [Triparma verrucosa]|uniref:Uncharacterized protein n=1 Tax=Triparma verrucosa TaxID=1606542 RepID=A0A9W7FHC3_9STRA|nr:hypothetical protein TrVE_jg14019 [Triparma verrucosa]